MFFFPWASDFFLIKQNPKQQNPGSKLCLSSSSFTPTQCKVMKVYFRLDSTEKNKYVAHKPHGKPFLTVSLVSSFCWVCGSYLSSYTKLSKTMLELGGFISMELKGGVPPEIASGTIRWSHQSQSSMSTVKFIRTHSSSTHLLLCSHVLEENSAWNYTSRHQ